MDKISSAVHHDSLEYPAAFDVSPKIMDPIRVLRDRSINREQLVQVLLQSFEEAQPNFPSIERIAATLCTSSRTLSRRLHAMDINFRQLKADYKKELAIAYLQDKKRSVKSIAQKLGYTNNSNFTKAFKDWTGKTPQKYRVEIIL